MSSALQGNVIILRIFTYSDAKYSNTFLSGFIGKIETI